MRAYTLSHLSDEVLLRDLTALVAQDRLTTASLLAHIAEVDARRLYAPAGYPSMHAYCVEELRLSEDAALKRIQVARAARRFPRIFEGLAEGRFHLSGIRLLAPYLTPENSGELLEAAIGKRKSEIEEMVARRFGAPGVAATMRAIVPIAHACADECDSEHAPGHVVNEITKSDCAPEDASAPGHLEEGRDEIATPSPERFLLQLSVGRSTREKLRYAQALLSHAVPSGDVAQVLDRALDALIRQLEKRKLGAGTRRRPGAGSGDRRRSARRGPTAHGTAAAGSRYIPAHVRRTVWERDHGQCTFVSEGGHRCGARRFLEFDHVDPVARGGQATVDGMRLRCRAHNQYEAERAFGRDFMARKRREARRAAAEAQERVQARESAKEATRDVVAGLRGLGCRADEARRAAELSETLPGTTIEERMRAALRFLGWRSIESPCPVEVVRPM